MSGVDERIVRMTFDNQKFVEKAKQTIQVMSNLKASLKLDKISTGFDKIQTSSKKLNLTSIAEDVDTISNRFNAMGVIAASALQKITHQAVAAGERLVSAFTIDPIKTGFEEYETQINAVQTILANTESKGSTLKDVNAALDELNKYADMTIYNFTEMTRNIGTFTAAGVDLDTSVSAIKGIANLAAVSGSTSQQASTAMYQLSQALAAGTVKLMDWNSVVNAGMGGQVFQDALKETARVHGIAIDSMIKEEGSFRETLQHGWLTSEVLTETLSKFTGDLTEAQLKSMGYTEKQAAAILKMGVTANDAATKVKTFTQLMDTLKEAAQSGWTSTWEILIGDFEEAKAFLTELSDTFSAMIGQSAEARNTLLTGWKDLGGRDMLIQSLRNSFQALLALLKPVQEAFEEVFPPVTAEMLLQMTQSLKDFTASLMISGRTAENIKNIFKAIFSVFKIVGSVALVAAQAIGKLIGLAARVVEILLYPVGDIARIFATIVDYVFQFVDGLGKFAQSIASLESVQMLLGTLATLFGTIQNVVGMVYDKFRSLAFAVVDNAFGTSALVFSKIADALNFLAGHLNNAIVKAVEFVSTLKDLPVVQGAISKLSNAFNTLRTNVSAVVSVVKDRLTSIFESAKSVLGPYVEQILPALQSAGEKVKNFLTDVFVNGVPITDKISHIFEVLSTRAREIVNIDFSSIIDNLKSYKDRILETVDASGKLEAMKNIFGGMKTSFSSFMSSTTDIVGKVKEKILEFTSWLSDKVANISIGDVIAAGAGASLIAFAMSLTKFTNIAADAIKPVAGILEGVQDIEKSVAGYINSLAKVKQAEARNATLNGVAKLIQSLALLAGAVALLANMDQEKVKTSAIVLGALAGGLILITAVAAKMLAEVNPEAIAKFSWSMLATGVSLIMMTKSLKTLAEIPTDRIASSLIAMGVMMAELAAFIIVVSRLAPSIAAGSGSMIAMSVALLLMSKAMGSLGDIDPSQIIASIAVLGLLGLLTAALNALSGKGSWKGAVGVIAVAVALNLMIKTLNDLAAIDADTAKVGIERLIELFGAVALLFVASSVSGKYAIKAGIAILAVSASLHVIVAAIEKMAAIDESTMSRAGEVAKKILIVFGLITAATGLAGKYGARAGAAIAMMSVAMLLLVASIAVMSKLDPDGLERGIEAVQRIMLMFALLIASTSVAKGANKLVTTIGVTMAALVGALAILSLINPDNLKAASTALTMVMGMFAAMIASTRFSKKANAAILLMLVVTGSLALMLKSLSNLPVESTLGTAASLSMLLVSLSASIAVLQFVNPSAAAKGVAGLIILVAAIGALLAALAGIEELSGGQAANFIQNGIPLLETIGSAIGGFIGNLAGSLMGSFAGSALEELGTSLTNFMNNVQGFLDGAKNIDQSVVDGVSSLVGMILMLTGAEVLNRLGNIGNIGALFGESGMDALGSDLVSFAGSLKEFTEALSGVDQGSLDNASKTVGTVLDMLKGVENEGGVKGFVEGSSSEAMGNLANVLPNLAKAVSAYSKALSEEGAVDYQVIQDSIEPVKTLFSLLDVIKEEGGWEDYISGSSSEAMGNLANVLPYLAKALGSYSSALTENPPDYDAIAGSIDPCKQLFTLLDAIKDEGGVIDWWGGSASEAIGNLSANLPALGEALSSYSGSVSAGIDYDAISSSIEPCKNLFSLLEYIRDEGGVLDWWGGSASEALGNLADKLPLLGDGLKSYSDSLTGFSIGKINDSLPAVQTLVSISQSMEAEGALAFFTESKSNALGNLASALPVLGGALTLYGAALSAANFDAINNSLPAIETIASVAQILGAEAMLPIFESNLTNSLKNLATSLPALGAGLTGYGAALAGCDFGAINSSLNGIQTLASIAAELQPEGGLLSVFGSSNSEALKQFSDNLPGLGSALSGFATNLGDFNPEMVSSAADTLKKLSEVSNEIEGAGGWEGLLSDIFGGGDSGVYQKLSSNLENMAGMLNAFGTNLASDALANIGPAMQQVNAIVDFVKSLDGINLTAVVDFGKTMMSIGDLGLPVFASSIADIAPEVSASLETLKIALSETVPEISELTSNLKSSIGKGNLDFTSEGKSIGSSFTNSLKSSLSSGLASATLTAANGATKLYKAIKNAFNGARSDFRAIGASIASSLASGLSNFNGWQLGANMMSGLARGISSNSSIASMAASKAASDAYEAAKEAVDSNSPAKKFIKLGADCDRGLAIGIYKYSRIVEAAGKGVGEETLNSAKIAMKSLDDINALGIDSQPTIRPVLDTSMIEAGSNKLAGMLEQNTRSIRLNMDVSSKLSDSANRTIEIKNTNDYVSNKRDTDRIVSAIGGLDDSLRNYSGDSYSFGGITYDESSAIGQALGQLVEAITVERRM